MPVATIKGRNYMSLVEWAKMLDPDGKIATVAEMLTQRNEILLDMQYIEGNLPTGHKTRVRTGLPEPTWRGFNQGVKPTHGTSRQVTIDCGMLEDWGEVDKEEADLNGNTAEYRLDEASAHLIGMDNSMAEGLIYGNRAVNPRQFDGLAMAYATPDSSKAQSAMNVIDCLGTSSDGGLSSIYAVVWNPQTIIGVFPKGSKAGLVHENLGEQTAQDIDGVSGTRMRVYQDHFVWKNGLAVRDWRFGARLANLPINKMLAGTSGAPDVVRQLIKLWHKIYAWNMGKGAIYLNRSMFEMLDLQRWDDVKAGGQLRFEQVDGVMTPTFRSIPLRRVDSILDTEDQAV